MLFQNILQNNKTIFKLFFRFLYAFVPGGKSMTDNHDIESSRMVKQMKEDWINNGGKIEDEKLKNNINKQLAVTIPSSFFGTLYGIIGTAIDIKNYKNNFNKIKDSYNNSVPNDAIIKKPSNFVNNK